MCNVFNHAFGKNLLRYRLAGALLMFSPEYCFVAEDDVGICGCLLATLDSKKFWTKYELAYLPEMREKYEKPTAENDKELTEAEVRELFQIVVKAIF